MGEVKRGGGGGGKGEGRGGVRVGGGGGRGPDSPGSVHVWHITGQNCIFIS